MPGTRTAGTVDGAPALIVAKFTMIDSVGDFRTVSLIGAPADMTNANIEALAVALQAGSNASLYDIRVESKYTGARAKSNALSAVFNNIGDNIVYHMKASPTDSQRGYIPAPMLSLFLAGTETVDPADTEVVAFMSAADDCVGSGYTGRSLRFTERRDINDAVRL